MWVRNVLSKKSKKKKNRTISDGIIWQFRKSCRKKLSIRSGTFFEGKLSLRTIVLLMYWWSYVEVSSTEFLLREQGLASEAVVKWKNYCRDMCAEYFMKNPLEFGGEGIYVEIDESALVRRKFNVGPQRVFDGKTLLFLFQDSLASSQLNKIMKKL